MTNDRPARAAAAAISSTEPVPSDRDECTWYAPRTAVAGHSPDNRTARGGSVDPTYTTTAAPRTAVAVTHPMSTRRTVTPPGGRLAVSDIALKRPLPPELANDIAAYVGCISGAIPIERYRQYLQEFPAALRVQHVRRDRCHPASS